MRYPSFKWAEKDGLHLLEHQPYQAMIVQLDGQWVWNAHWRPINIRSFITKIASSQDGHHSLRFASLSQIKAGIEEIIVQHASRLVVQYKPFVRFGILDVKKDFHWAYTTDNATDEIEGYWTYQDSIVLINIPVPKKDVIDGPVGYARMVNDPSTTILQLYIRDGDDINDIKRTFESAVCQWASDLIAKYQDYLDNDYKTPSPFGIPFKWETESGSKRYYLKHGKFEGMVADPSLSDHRVWFCRVCIDGYSPSLFTHHLQPEDADLTRCQEIVEQEIIKYAVRTVADLPAPSPQEDIQYHSDILYGQDGYPMLRIFEGREKQPIIALGFTPALALCLWLPLHQIILATKPKTTITWNSIIRSISDEKVINILKRVPMTNSNERTCTTGITEFVKAANDFVPLAHST